MDNSKLRTLILILIGIGILIAGYLTQSYLAEQKASAPQRILTKRIKTVQTKTVHNAQLDSKLDIQGRLQAYNKVALFSEVGGMIKSTGRPFKEGTYFKKGSIMIEIDDQEPRLNLQSQKANLLTSIASIMPDLKIDYPEAFTHWNDYLTNFDIDSSIRELPTPSDQREKLFIASRNIYSQYYAIKSAEERLSKYTIYAPFSGVLTQADVDRGTIIRSGQQLGEIMATSYYEMVANIPLSKLDYIKPSSQVELYSEDIEGSWTGKISRISDQIDPGSQTVDVYISVRGQNLRDGMFMRGFANTKSIDNVVEIDRDLLIDESKVFIVRQDTLLSAIPITVEKFNRNTVLVSGIPEAAELLVSDVAGAFDGMRVNREDAPKESIQSSGN